MFNKIKEYIKSLEFKKKYFLLSTLKTLIPILIFIVINVISLKFIINIADLLEIIPENRFYIGFIFILFFILSILISIGRYVKLSRYFLKFYTDEEIIKNINYFYVEDKGDVNNQFVNLYKEKKEILFLNVKEITEKLGKNWVILTKIDVRNLLINKDVKWYSNQISKREFYVYCKTTIQEIIENEEKEYYHIILELFNDFIEEEKILKMKNKLKKENVVSIIQI